MPGFDRLAVHTLAKRPRRDREARGRKPERAIPRSLVERTPRRGGTRGRRRLARRGRRRIQRGHDRVEQSLVGDIERTLDGNRRRTIGGSVGPAGIRNRLVGSRRRVAGIIAGKRRRQPRRLDGVALGEEAFGESLPDLGAPRLQHLGVRRSGPHGLLRQPEPGRDLGDGGALRHIAAVAPHRGDRAASGIVPLDVERGIGTDPRDRIGRRPVKELADETVLRGGRAVAVADATSEFVEKLCGAQPRRRGIGLRPESRHPVVIRVSRRERAAEGIVIDETPLDRPRRIGVGEQVVIARPRHAPRRVNRSRSVVRGCRDVHDPTVARGSDIGSSPRRSPVRRRERDAGDKRGNRGNGPIPGVTVAHRRRPGTFPTPREHPPPR